MELAYYSVYIQTCGLYFFTRAYTFKWQLRSLLIKQTSYTSGSLYQKEFQEKTSSQFKQQILQKSNYLGKYYLF